MADTPRRTYGWADVDPHLSARVTNVVLRASAQLAQLAQLALDAGDADLATWAVDRACWSRPPTSTSISSTLGCGPGRAFLAGRRLVPRQRSPGRARREPITGVVGRVPPAPRRLVGPTCHLGTSPEPPLLYRDFGPIGFRWVEERAGRSKRDWSTTRHRRPFRRAGSRIGSAPSLTAGPGPGPGTMVAMVRPATCLGSGRGPDEAPSIPLSHGRHQGPYQAVTHFHSFRDGAWRRWWRDRTILVGAARRGWGQGESRCRRHETGCGLAGRRRRRAMPCR